MRVLVALVVLAGCRFDGGRYTSTSDAQPDATDDAMEDTLMADCEGLWHMDEDDWTSGVLDSCGGDDDGAPSGSAMLEDDSVRGRVARTTDGCITVPDSPRLRPHGAFTVSAWIQPNCMCDDEGIVAKRTGFGTDSAYAMYLSKNGGADYHLWVDVDTENNRFEHTGDAFVLDWRQVTMTFDGAREASERVAIYIDGELKTYVAEDSTTVAVPQGTPPPVSIGCLPNGGTSLNGLVDDVAIWSRALSETEVGAWHMRTSR